METDNISGEDEITDVDVEEYLNEFLDELKLLCTAYGLSLEVCDCGVMNLVFHDGLLKRYKRDGTHIEAEFIEFVKAA